MNKTYHLIFIIMTLLSFSCSKGSSGNKKETRIEETQIPDVMNRQNFSCASISGNCPEGIARLLVLNKSEPDRSAVCSGFMIGPNRLVTNNHCVSTLQQCRSTFLAIYDGGNGYFRTRCTNIITTATDGPDPNDPSRMLDFTVMETAGTYLGNYFRLSDTSARPGDVLEAWVVDHTGLDDFPANLTDARVTEFECTVMNQNERSSLMMMECPIISGNSGSPVLNQRDEVVGVLWGGSASTFDSSLDLDIRRELNEVGLATDVKYLKNSAGFID